MNYPIWEIPAGGLLIAAVSVFHVFISHFAIGGGLFLVLLESKARREGDDSLLAYVRTHSRFFLLVTLVLGAVTGVGIWFTIGLVNPQGTASLISTFMWGWAIEWTFFVIEIAAAMVYYYGWDRLDPRQHLTVGWIYFISSWLSLVAIAGIIGYMLTPGDWLSTRSFWDGFLNPSYLPSVATRTFICVGLAGLYALFTASFLRDARLKDKVVRYASLKWILPMAVALPFSAAWYISAVAGAGTPVAAVLGTEETGLSGVFDILLNETSSGYPSFGLTNAARSGSLWWLRICEGRSAQAVGCRKLHVCERCPITTCTKRPPTTSGSTRTSCGSFHS
jgi:cytochrome bd-type quinol oxidase subunit 1